MSADNYYVVLPHPDGGFTPVMGFASDEQGPTVRADAVAFETPLEALNAVVDEYAEYGHSISPLCYTEPEPDPAEVTADGELQVLPPPVVPVPAYLDDEPDPEDDLSGFLNG